MNHDDFELADGSLCYVDTDEEIRLVTDDWDKTTVVVQPNELAGFIAWLLEVQEKLS